MSFSFLSRSGFPSLGLALALCAAAGGRAQSAPAPAGPAHSHTPAAPSHGDSVVTLDQFVTSVTPFERNQVDLAQATTVLAGRALRLKQQATLGETLAAEVGVHATSFGAGASRPIIRGLGGDRIRVLENSIGTLDASVASPDHAVSVEPFLIERIEVVRGPASLLYGSNAVGGVVNVITHRIETDLPAEPVRGSAEVRRGSAADEWAGGGVLDLAMRTGADRALVLHLDGFRRTAENLRIPGFAESARVRAAEAAEAREHGEPAPAFARDRLPNSALTNTSAAAGLSYVSKTLHLGVSHSGFNSDYGVPGHAHEEETAAPGGAEGVRIGLRQRRTDVQGEWHGGTGFVRDARFKFGRARYRHTEFEPDGAIGTVFTNRGHEGRIELLHGDGKPRSGAFGAQHTRSDFNAVGEEAFLPSSRTDSAALFAFEEIAAGAVAWQFGGRVERSKIAAAGHAARRDDEFSGSAGAVWKISPAHALAISVTRTGRAANAQELFAYGPHAGTGAFEIGDARLGAERSLSAEVSLRRRTGFVTGALTVFTNRFSGYIFEQPTGLVAVEHDGEWEFLPPDAEEAEEHGGLPVYRYVQRRARFHGVEVETLWHLHDHSDWQLDLRLAADFTRGREGGRHLPRIPAGRVSAGLFWSTAGWSAGVESQFVARQTRVALNETPSGRYALVSAHVSRTADIGGLHAEFFLRGTNLGNAEARPHPSFVKDLAPLAGRGVLAGVRISF
ncbi:MAG: TonB-dependent receptor [Opitutaceae bacterium]|nr:TonB-dependent receptor [Opitutaceae bacterium]